MHLPFYANFTLTNPNDMLDNNHHYLAQKIQEVKKDQNMSFLRQLIFGGIGSCPTSSVHSQTHDGMFTPESEITMENLQVVKTLHVLNLLENEIITRLVMDLVNLTNKRDVHELEPCEKYLHFIQQEISLETNSKTDEFLIFDLRVAVKVVQLEKIEAAFRLVKNVLTKEKIKTKKLDEENPEENNEKLREYNEQLERNRTLKSEISQLRIEIDKAEIKVKADEENFVKDVNRVLDKELNRIQDEFSTLIEKTESLTKDNEKLKAKIQEQEYLLNCITKKIDEKDEIVQTEIKQLEAKRIDSELRLRNAENDYEEISKKLQNLKEDLEEQNKMGEMNGKNYEEKLGAFLRSREDFKQGIEQRNETRCQRLKEDNEKLRQENHELSYKLLEMGMRQLFSREIRKDPDLEQCTRMS